MVWISTTTTGAVSTAAVTAIAIPTSWFGRRRTGIEGTRPLNLSFGGGGMHCFEVPEGAQTRTPAPRLPTLPFSVRTWSLIRKVEHACPRNGSVSEQFDSATT